VKQPDRAPVAILTLALVVLVLAGSVLWLHLSEPSDGARLPVGESTWQSNGVRVTALSTRPDGPREGDVMVTIEGRSTASWAQGVVCGKAIVPAESAKHLLSCRRLVAVTLLPLRRPHGEGSGGAMICSVLAQLVGLLLDLGRLLMRTDQSKDVEILLLRRQLPRFGPKGVRFD
jgi:hypothetical protein